MAFRFGRSWRPDPKVALAGGGGKRDAQPFARSLVGHRTFRALSFAARGDLDGRSYGIELQLGSKLVAADFFGLWLGVVANAGSKRKSHV
jgi:hypothetical protein